MDCGLDLAPILPVAYTCFIRALRSFPDGVSVSLSEMTLLSSQPALLDPVAATATTSNPEQRMLEKRTKVIKELLQTERDYIRDLEMCVQKLLVPLQEAQVRVAHSHSMTCESQH